MLDDIPEKRIIVLRGGASAGDSRLQRRPRGADGCADGLDGGFTFDAFHRLRHVGPGRVDGRRNLGRGIAEDGVADLFGAGVLGGLVQSSFESADGGGNHFASLLTDDLKRRRCYCVSVGFLDGLGMRRKNLEFSRVL